MIMMVAYDNLCDKMCIMFLWLTCDEFHILNFAYIFRLFYGVRLYSFGEINQSDQPGQQLYIVVPILKSNLYEI